MDERTAPRPAPGATATPIAYAIIAGLSFCAAQTLLFMARRVAGLGDAALANAGTIAYVGLIEFLVGAATWWLFVARRSPSETSVSRGVIVGASSSLVARAISPIAQSIVTILNALRTDGAGDLMEGAGEMALLLVAGIMISLLWGWMDVVAAMIVGAMLVAWHRRGAPQAAFEQVPESEQVPPGRTRCDACGEEYPASHYLRAAGSRGYICGACASSQ